MRTLTVKQRIQLHLFDYRTHEEAYEVPVEVSQSGIARAVGIRVHHVPQYVRPLMEDGLVTERTSHIRKKARRRKVYFPTAKGRSQSAALREELLKEVVAFRTAGGDVRQLPFMQVIQEHRRGSRLVELLGELRSLGYVPEVVTAPKGKTVDFTQEAPKVERFFGRARELEAVVSALEKAPVVVVTGMAGVGKTTLASKVAEAFQGERSVFWRQVRPWDTWTDLALRVGAFLKSAGKVGLHANLMGTEPKDLSRIEELLRTDLAGLDGVLVFDDVHHAREDARSFLSVLLRVLKPQTGVSALFISRGIPELYSRREVEVEGTIIEIGLGGLDREAGMTLLVDAGLRDPLLGSLVDACGGSPLFLKLVAAGRGKPPEEAWKTVETYIAEEIEPELEETQRGCLEVASFYQVPVPSSGLLLEEKARGRTLTALRARGFLNDTGSARYVIHESIRDYFQRSLPAERRNALVARIVPWLSQEAERAAKRGHVADAVSLLCNAAHVEFDEESRRTVLERVGDLRRLTGDLQGGIDAFRTALKTAQEPRDRARLRQKIAGMIITQGLFEEAEQEIEAGLDVLPPGPSPEAGWLLFRRALVRYAREDHDRALKDLVGVISWRPGTTLEPDLWGWLANLRGLIYLEDPKRHDLALARADFETAVEAFEETGDRRGLSRAYNNLGLTALEAGHPERALEYLDKAASIAEAAGDVAGRQVLLQTRAWCLCECLGDYEAAEALLEESYQLAKMTNRQKMLWHYFHFANLYQRQGRCEEARESQEYFVRASEGWMAPRSRIFDMSLLARMCVRCGDFEGAEAWLGQAEEILGQDDSDAGRHSVEWARALLLDARGDEAGAALTYGKVAALASEHEQGESLLDYGRFLAKRKDSGRAREILGRARSAFESLHLQPLTVQVEDLLRDLGPTAT